MVNRVKDIIPHCVPIIKQGFCSRKLPNLGHLRPVFA
jgi:hypothetical protein